MMMMMMMDEEVNGDDKDVDGDLDVYFTEDCDCQITC